MPYTNLTQVESVLAQALTTSAPGQSGARVKLVDIGTKVNTNTIPTTEVNYFIAQADGIINAALSQQYVTPLQERCDMQMTLNADADEYANDVTVVRMGDLSPGDILIFNDGTNEDRAIVESVDSSTTFTLTDLLANAYLSGTKVRRIKFPDPIPFIAARLAAASIYDKHLKAQTEPGKSDYGDTLRKNAIADLNNIREGRTIINAVRRGWRFADATLVDRYTLKAPPENDSTRSEGNQ
jgi:hypothetical protein